MLTELYKIFIQNINTAYHSLYRSLQTMDLILIALVSESTFVSFTNDIREEK